MSIDKNNGNLLKLQPASYEIYQMKYQLVDKNNNSIDKSILDTFSRVARTLSEVEHETVRDTWYKKFLWCLVEGGCLPGGRIISNAGAGKYKPETSLINCVVSGTIADSMSDILMAVHEAGMTLKSGCGIGYEFSTLRPKNAYVAGAGANTSGPLSFMDIFDKMCFTVSSAGGRRGAQMGTLDIQHPDVFEFIKAKRENGRLRQFNLSLLITDGFINAVKNDDEWKLVFPVKLRDIEEDGLDLADSSKIYFREWPVHDDYFVNEDGLVACKIYKTVKARVLWNAIMTATYDYAEPGFLLIDRINRLNNLWWVENIRATNPCVTADTRLHTQFGMVQVGELYKNGSQLEVTVDNRTLELGDEGVSVRSAIPVFMTSESADVYKVTTEAGYEIKATDWHEFYTNRGKIKLKDLKVGDELLIQSGKGQFGNQGNKDIGIVIGLITGDGHFTNTRNGSQTAVIGLWEEDRSIGPDILTAVNKLICTDGSDYFPNRRREVSVVSIPSRNAVSIKSVLLARVLDTYGFNKTTKLSVPEVIWQGTEECVKGYLSALFQVDGTINCSSYNRCCSIRLSSSHLELLKDVQKLLSNFGIFCGIYKRRDAGEKMMPDGKGGEKAYFCKTNYEIIIGSESRDIFMREIGFIKPEKNQKYYDWLKDGREVKKCKYITPIASIEYLGKEAVFDTTQADHNSVIFGGVVTGQCGEQNLPPYAACLLGSINLAKFVKNPFTDQAEFDWDKFNKTVKIFSRMLDNVVDINNLPLKQQRDDILRKRRHGMGYTGLGSALTLMRIKYGSKEAVEFTDLVTSRLALVGWEAALELSMEKGAAPIMNEKFIITKAMLGKCSELTELGYKVGDSITGAKLHSLSKYMKEIQKLNPKLVEDLGKYGARYSHATTIPPVGTTSFSLGNNVSNGIEPSFAHQYSRNVIVEGKKSKEKVNVFSYELLLYKELINPDANPFSTEGENKLPDYFSNTDTITAEEHVDMQGAAQKWIDSSISKTLNIPTDYPFEKFKDIYMYGYEKGLKGLATFRFNPEVFQGVLIKESDLENTKYQFTLEDGSVVEVAGNEEIMYDGEMHGAANLFDALKEGYYGKF